MKKPKRGYIANTFYHYANEYRKHLTDEDTIEKVDMTQKFWAELDSIIEAGELINININGLPTTGKSTLGFEIGRRLTKKHFKRTFGVEDIDRDNKNSAKP